MITAKFYLKPSNGSIHMTLKGHAKAAPYGEDLICASATMLAYTVAQAVQFMHEQGKLKKKPKICLHWPWDSPGKNTGVGCHFLLQCMKVKSESEVAQSCPTLCDPMDYSSPSSSIHGIF